MQVVCLETNYLPFLMKLNKILLLLIMLFKLFGCNTKNKDFIFEKFRSQVEAKGMKIDSVDVTGLIYISQGELTLKVSLDNIRKNYERDKDDSLISDFVETLVSYSIELPKKWVDAKKDILISFFPNDFDFQDFIHSKVTDEFSKVYVHSGENKFTWITKDDLKEWNISEKELDAQANINADRWLEVTKIAYDTIENRKLGFIENDHTTLKGALLFAPKMRYKLKKDIDFPFYAVLPVRDFCYIFSEKDLGFFSERIGSTVIKEYKESGYPITTEILKFSEKGVQSVGKFPIE